MFRMTFLIVIAISFAMARAQSDSEPKSDLSFLGFDDEEDIFPEEGLSIDEDEDQTRTFGGMGSVLLAIRQQVKDIIFDLGTQFFGYIKAIFNHFKVKILKKLGLYTLRDVFYAVFDGVVDFVGDSPPQALYAIKEAPKPTTETSFFGEDFSLASLFKKSLRK